MEQYVLLDKNKNIVCYSPKFKRVKKYSLKMMYNIEDIVVMKNDKLFNIEPNAELLEVVKFEDMYILRSEYNDSIEFLSNLKLQYLSTIEVNESLIRFLDNEDDIRILEKANKILKRELQLIEGSLIEEGEY